MLKNFKWYFLTELYSSVFVFLYSFYFINLILFYSFCLFYPLHPFLSNFSHSVYSICLIFIGFYSILLINYNLLSSDKNQFIYSTLLFFPTFFVPFYSVLHYSLVIIFGNYSNKTEFYCIGLQTVLTILPHMTHSDNRDDIYSFYFILLYASHHFLFIPFDINYSLVIHSHH